MLVEMDTGKPRPGSCGACWTSTLVPILRLVHIAGDGTKLAPWRQLVLSKTASTYSRPGAQNQDPRHHRWLPRVPPRSTFND